MSLNAAPKSGLWSKSKLSAISVDSRSVVDGIGKVSFGSSGGTGIAQNLLVRERVQMNPIQHTKTPEG